MTKVNDNIEDLNIKDYTERAYLEYSMSVVKGRALPSVQDGLKPVHRRIFYSMHKMGISDTSIPKKCARVTGDVIGKYHPHGDVAVYDAMVVQAQTFRMMNPVIEGIGNFGSRDGDGAAAARYTECKFYPISKVLFDELDQDAVRFIANYDGNEIEPEFMPARLPFILLNVNEGIAVGMATNIPSHNTQEVIDAVIAYVKNEDISLNEILEYIKGPDFPTGAQLISSKEEINKVYREGRGGFRLRAKYTVENPGTKKWKLVFHELPYTTSIAKVREEIDALMYPESKLKKDEKGKLKKLSTEQIRLKTLFLNSIASFEDESDKKTPVRLVIEPKNTKQSPEELATILLAKTGLESNFSANFVMVGLDGNPKQKGILDIIKEWTSFRLTTIERRCQYHLNKIRNRCHILDGRKIVLNYIDDVIQLIKTSKSPKDDLMAKYSLTEIQAQDVLELRLRQLGNLEMESLENEYSNLLEKKSELEAILESPESLKKQMIKELVADGKKYGKERVTEVVAEAKKIDLSKVQEKTAKVSEEEITVAISNKEWVKTLKGKKSLEDFSFKEGDGGAYSFTCLNTDAMAMFDADGKVYNSALNDFTKDGAPIATLAQFQNKLEFAFPVNEKNSYLMVQSSGFIFIVKGSNLLTKMKAGKEMVTMNGDKSKLFVPESIPNDVDTSNWKVAIITSDNKLVLFKLSEVSTISKGAGVVTCALPNDTRIKSVKIIKDDVVLVEATNSKGKKEKVIKVEGDLFNKILRKRSSSAKGIALPTKDPESSIDFATVVEETPEAQ